MSLYEKNIEAMARAKPTLGTKKEIPKTPKEILEEWFDNLISSLDRGDEHWNSFFEGIDADDDVKRKCFRHDILCVGFPNDSSKALYRKFTGVVEPPQLKVADVITFIKNDSKRFFYRFPADHPVLKNCSVTLLVRKDVANLALVMMPFAWHDVGYGVSFNTNDPHSSYCAIM